MDRLKRLVEAQLETDDHELSMHTSDFDVDTAIEQWHNSNSLFQFIEHAPPSSSLSFYQSLYTRISKAHEIESYIKDQLEGKIDEKEVSTPLSTLYSSIIDPSEYGLIQEVLKLKLEADLDESSSLYQSRINVFLTFARACKSIVIRTYLADLHSQSQSQSPSQSQGLSSLSATAKHLIAQNHLSFYPSHLTSTPSSPSPSSSSHTLQDQEHTIYLKAPFLTQAITFYKHPHLLNHEAHSTFFENWWIQFHAQIDSQRTSDLSNDDQTQDATQKKYLTLWQNYFNLAATEDPFKTPIADHLKRLFFEWIFQDLLDLQAHVIFYQVRFNFETLISQARPKDQKVGSLFFNPQDPTQITIIFINRDGRLLAQRNLLWPSLDPQDLPAVFKPIRIRTLVVSNTLSAIEETAVQTLNTLYEIKRINSTGLDPVLRPLNLSSDAQKALRLGQRYVAPLRFWIRGDLNAFTESILSQEELDCISRHKPLTYWFQKLKEQNEIKWVYFRRKRMQREQLKQAQSVRTSLDSSNVESHIHPSHSVQVSHSVPTRSQRSHSSSSLNTPKSARSNTRSTLKTHHVLSSKSSQSKETQKRRSSSSRQKPNIHQIERKTIGQLDKLFGKK